MKFTTNFAAATSALLTFASADTNTRNFEASGATYNLDVKAEAFRISETVIMLSLSQELTVTSSDTIPNDEGDISL
jgi:hypothetical protein